jgi:hypothetical protein
MDGLRRSRAPTGRHPEIIATSAREGTGIARLRAALALLATPAREAHR